MNDRWDLSVLYKDFDDPSIAADTAALEASFDALEKLYAEAGEKEPLQVLEKYAELTEQSSLLGEKLGNFAYLSLAVEADNEQAQRLSDLLQDMSVREEMVHSDFERYIGGLKDLKKLIASSEALRRVGFALERAAKDAAHIPGSESLKWLLKMSLNGAKAFSNLRDKLDAAHTVTWKGEEIPLSAARALAYDADPETRRAAYEAELASYSRMEIPMAACLNGIKGEALTMIEAEHFDTVLDRTLFHSKMDRETLDAMWTAVRESLPAFRRYLRRKGELLGHKDGIPFYDLFAPLSFEGAENHVYTVEEAKEILVREMSKFTPEMGAFIEHALENRWVDLYPRAGKGGGAFCSGLHGQGECRVLTNFAGSFSDVSTLAHELGHGWHDRCMNGLPCVMTNAPMPLAETASIFNETLLFRAVVKDASPAERLKLLEGNLMETTQCIVDIYSRFLFEGAVVEARKTHNPSPAELCGMMLKAQEESYGDGLDKEYRHPYMWACKCHYYMDGLDFYNFPYAFGQLFGTGIYARYTEEGDAFVPKYNALLRSCGSMEVKNVAQSVGIDVTDPDFWRQALKVYVDEIDEFIALSAGMAVC